MFLATAKFFNAVRIAGKQESYVTSEYFEIELIGNIIRIKPRKGDTVCTSLFNTPYWTEIPTVIKPKEKEVTLETKRNDKDTSKSPSKRSKPKKTK